MARALPGARPGLESAMTHLQRLTPDGFAPETSRPDPKRVRAGDPIFTTWSLVEREGLFCGLWECTPGKWRIASDEWEYCRILSGVSVLA